MKITLKQLTLLNFKGQRSLTIYFNEQTSISGANATGKSTIFDAFTWMLFGKDSEDRADFDIKTLDENNHVIERIPHEVEAVLSVDGQTLKLKRCYCEKWTRKRGSETQEFTGHETKYFVNDVEKSQKDYNTEISGICNEQLFKFITNPLFFPSQKKDVQREMLIQLSGDVSDADIISQRDDFTALFAELSGKKLDDFKKELSAKKKTLKDALEKAPVQIEEVKRGLPEAQDWPAIEAEISEKKAAVSDIDNQIADKAKALQKQQDARADIQRQIGAIKEQRTSLEIEHNAAFNQQYNEAKIAYDKAVAHITVKLHDLKERKSQLETEKQSLITRKTVLEKQLEGARTEWTKVNDSQITFNESDFICPTCKRPMEVDDIESKQEEMRQNFNRNKASALQELTEKGKAFSTNLASACESLKKVEESLPQITANITGIEIMPAPVQPVVPAAPDFTTNEKHMELTQQIAALEDELNAPGQSFDRTEQQTRKQELQDRIDTLHRELALKGEIEKGEKRIEELSLQIRSNAQELALLEKQEFTILEFSKAKMEAIEAKTNGLFSFVRFKLFETQINGGEVPTCEAMVDGVPFSSLNNAMKINAGLDIITAICRKNNVFAPIFIDNAEAVNKLLPTSSQMIRLVVSEEKVLTVK